VAVLSSPGGLVSVTFGGLEFGSLAVFKFEECMPIVKCPKCKKRYDPGVDEALDDLDDAPVEMSVKVVCPACGQWLRLPEHEKIPAPAAPPEILKAMMAQSRLVEDSEEADQPRKPKKPKNKKRERQEEKPWWKFW
jgi:hypothetical protein